MEAVGEGQSEGRIDRRIARTKKVREHGGDGRQRGPGRERMYVYELCVCVGGGLHVHVYMYIHVSIGGPAASPARKRHDASARARPPKSAA